MNKFKIITAIVISLVLVISLFFIFSSRNKENTDNYEENTKIANILGKEELIVGFDDAFPPMGFRDESGEIVGFDIDLAKEAGKRLGIEMKFKPVVWDTVILSLNNKDIDIIWSGMTITEERKSKILFSIPYFKGEDIFIVKKDSEIKTIDDLSGKSVGVQAGSNQEEALNKSSLSKTISEIKSYETLPDMILDLDAGRIGAVLCDNFTGFYYIEKTLRKSGEFISFGSGFELTYTGIGIRKEDEDLKKEFDRILKEMIEDDTASNISIKWFGKDLVAK